MIFCKGKTTKLKYSFYDLMTTSSHYVFCLIPTSYLPSS